MAKLSKRNRANSDTVKTLVQRRLAKQQAQARDTLQCPALDMQGINETLKLAIGPAAYANYVARIKEMTNGEIADDCVRVLKFLSANPPTIDVP